MASSATARSPPQRAPGRDHDRRARRQDRRRACCRHDSLPRADIGCQAVAWGNGGSGSWGLVGIRAATRPVAVDHDRRGRWQVVIALARWQKS